MSQLNPNDHGHFDAAALAENLFGDSMRLYAAGSLYPIRVGLRAVGVSSDPPGAAEGVSRLLPLYDTSGPWGERSCELDSDIGLIACRDCEGTLQNLVETLPKPSPSRRVTRLQARRSQSLPALPPRRRLRARGGCGITQRQFALRGVITPEMEYAAIRERICMMERLERSSNGVVGLFPAPNPRSWPDITPEFVRSEVAAGRAIIPANINHPELEPMVIGSKFLVKINANIGSSPLSSDARHELDKALTAILWGADTIMDLSTGEDPCLTREYLLRNSPVPLGAVPIYESLQRTHGCPEDLSWELVRDVIIEQAEQGVDYFTLHAGVLLRFLPAAARRLCGIVSRGGSIMAAWCKSHREENFLYTNFSELCEILAAYDVCISLGDGLRPGCLDDANDEAQFAELQVLGELTRAAWERGVQVMVEGPGHVPLDTVEMNITRQIEVCSGAPFYTLGPVVADIAPGYDHITAALGGALIAAKGAAMLCYVTPREHLGLPDMEDVRQGVVAAKLAAHAADAAKGHPGALARDRAMASARARFSWEEQFALSLDPLRARELFVGDISGGEAEKRDHCTMCGREFCAMRMNARNES